MAASSLYHSVYFWLREGGTPESTRKDAEKTIRACRDYLPGIPGIVTLTVGVPGGTDGGMVDSSYGVALLIEFENKDAHDAYDIHPNHQRLIAECGELWSRVQVYDMVPA